MVYEFEDGQKILLFAEGDRPGYYTGVNFWELVRCLKKYANTMNIDSGKKAVIFSNLKKIEDELNY